MMRKWIVCGGRVGRHLSRRRVQEVLDHLAESLGSQDALTVIHGQAPWVDQWAGRCARDRGHFEDAIPIDDEIDGISFHAPKRRNVRMYEKHQDAECCIGFPGGGGTNHMMDVCHEAGIPVGDVEIDKDGTWEIKWWPQK